MRRNEWEEFFDGHAPVYMDNVEHIWGGTAGNWGRHKIHLDEMEIMVVARKATERGDET